MILQVTKLEDRKRLIELMLLLDALMEKERAATIFLLKPRLLSMKECRKFRSKDGHSPIVSIPCFAYSAALNRINEEREKLYAEHHSLVMKYYSQQVPDGDERPDPCLLDITVEEVETHRKTWVNPYENVTFW